MKITIQDLQPYYDRCRDVLAPEKAGVLGDRQAESLGISLNKEASVRRVWQGLDEKMVYYYKAFLDYFTDASMPVDSMTPCHYVRDPKVGDGTNGKVIAPGVYRNAFTIVRPMADDKYMLIQELRLGWIEQLVSEGQIDWSEARVETLDWLPGDAGTNANHNYYTIVWKGVSPERVHDIVKSLDALTPDGWTPVVNGNQLDSVRRLMVRSQEEADGSATVRVMVANSRLKYTAYGSWRTERQTNVTYHFGVPSDMVQAVLNAERVDGAVARVSPPDRQGLHDLTIEVTDPESYSKIGVKTQLACTFDVATEYYLGVSEAAADAIVLPTSSEAGVSYTMQRNSRGDGFFDVVIQKRTSKPQSIAEYTAEDSAGRKIYRAEYLNQTTEPTYPAAETGRVVRVQKSLNSDCSKDLVVEKIESQEQSGLEARGTVKYTSIGTLTQNDKTPADFTQPSTPGITRTYQRRVNPDGSADVSVRDDQAPLLGGSTLRSSVTGGGGTGTVQRNVHPAPSAPTPTIGTIVNQDLRENEDGTWDSVTRSDTSPVLPMSERVIRKDKTIVGEGTRNDRTEPSVPVRGDNEKVTFRKSRNEDGTWDHMTIRETAASGLTAGGGSKSNCFDLGTDVAWAGISTADKETYKTDALANIPDKARIVWSERENDDGSWDFSYRYEIAPGLVSNSATSRAKGGITENIRRNILESELSTFPPVAGIGETITLRQDKNPDCSWDEYERVETAPPLTGDINVVRHDLTAVTARNLNAAARDDDLAIVDGQILQVTNDENPDGTWNTSRTLTTAIPQGYTATYQSGGRDVNVTLFRNQTGTWVESALGALTPSRINTWSAQPNEYGLYDGQITSQADTATASGSAGSETPRTATWSVTIDGVTYTYTSRLTSFESTAQDHVAGSSAFTSEQWSKLERKPGYSYIGRGKYLAWRVTVA